MELNKYQAEAMTTCLPTSDNTLYMLTMISEENGELQGKFSKAIRKGHIIFAGGNDFVFNEALTYEEREEWRELVKKELGDILWGIAGMGRMMGFTLEEIAYTNLKKLAERKKNATIDGSGDGVTKEERR